MKELSPAFLLIFQALSNGVLIIRVRQREGCETDFQPFRRRLGRHASFPLKVVELPQAYPALRETALLFLYHQAYTRYLFMRSDPVHRAVGAV